VFDLQITELTFLSLSSVGPPNKIQQRALPFLLRGADIIAQAPPTQERIAAYVIPAIQVVLTRLSVNASVVGPIVVLVSTTVDQATQAQRMIRDLGGPIGVRSALGVGVSSGDLSHELRILQQSVPHIVCGTPQKLHALFTNPNGLKGGEVRFLVLDEVDQLIARNLHDYILNIVKLFPSSRSRSAMSTSPGSASSTESLGGGAPFGRRMSSFVGAPSPEEPAFERQTAMFSNTVPQDVLNLGNTIQLRDAVRVLVRRDGNVTQSESNSQGQRGLRQFYLYLAFGSRADAAAAAAPALSLVIIGSGRGGAVGSSTSVETIQAREWKLDALADLFDDIDLSHAIVHVGGMQALDSVAYKLATKGLETIPIHSDMNANSKMAAISKFRNPLSPLMKVSTKVLVIFDVHVKANEVPHCPLIINYGNVSFSFFAHERER
jgi:superfamily II DNA/RNA helicase